jgi:diguanylate cyclase
MNTPDPRELFEKALAIARKALPFMGETKIPATPQNYMIFYLYFDDESEVVRKVVDEELTKNMVWGAETTERIFNRLFTVEANLDFFRFNERLAGQIKEMTQHIIQETKASAEAADQSSQRLSDSLDKGSRIQEIVQAAEWLKETIAEVTRIKEVSDHLGRSLTEKSVRLDEVVASLDQLEVMILTDELTRLTNRRGWEQRLNHEFERFNRYERPCSMMILDLDDFKEINDKHGHLIGDKVLQEVARGLMNDLRSMDTAARYGGEEFTCLLPETDLKGAVQTAERLRMGIVQTLFTVRNAHVPITASFGVATFRKGDKDPQEALARADQALYQAKSKGKNRVCHEAEEQGGEESPPSETA